MKINFNSIHDSQKFKKNNKIKSIKINQIEM